MPWPFVSTFLDLDEVDSTSDRAARLVQDVEIALPMCVWAHRQTRGRGRGRHQWFSDPGSLTFTIAIDPAAHGLSEASDPKLALATATAVIEAVERLGFQHPGLGIRWPNDVQVGRQKLGGILPERVDTTHGRRLLIGVGLNVTTDLDALPAEVRGMASSLTAIGGPAIAADLAIQPRLLSAILDRFGATLQRLVDRDPGLLAFWNERDLLRDERVVVNLGPRTVAGIGAGIDEEGTLGLDDGRQVIRISGGQVLR